MSGFPWPEGVSPDEIREALIGALRRRDRATLERLAGKLEEVGGITAARAVRAIAEAKPRLH